MDGSPISISKSMKLLGVTLDNKLTFEEHLRAVVTSIAQKTGLLRKFCKTLDYDNAIFKFFALILPSFEYCMLVWLSVDDRHNAFG